MYEFVPNICTLLLRRVHDVLIKLKTACFELLNLNVNISFKYAKTDAVDCYKLLVRLWSVFCKHNT